MTDALVARWARRYVLTSAVALLLWQAGLVVGVLPRRAEVVLGLYGVVLLVVFGKAYALVPAYFDRTLALPRAIAVQYPLSVGGTALLALAAVDGAPQGAGAAGGTLWAFGVAVFLCSLAWTIRTNPTGSETATGDAKADRQPVDRLANAFVPIVLGYLAVGAYETVAVRTALPSSPLGGSVVATSHLLGAGAATLLVFAIGYRLLPRFLVASPPRGVVPLVLGSGAIAPALLAAHVGGGPWLRVGALLEAIAITGFAGSYAVMVHRSDARRVGFYGPLLGGACGVLAVGLGVSFAVGSIHPALVLGHLRLNLLGFLGLTIVGVTFQFYPPAIGSFPAANDRTAVAVLLALAGGLCLQVLGLVAGVALPRLTGAVITTIGALGYTYLLVSTLASR